MSACALNCPLTLPFTCTTIVISSSLIKFASHVGHDERLIDFFSPSWLHNSSVIWGANGDRIFRKVLKLKVESCRMPAAGNPQSQGLTLSAQRGAVRRGTHRIWFLLESFARLRMLMGKGAGHLRVNHFTGRAGNGLLWLIPLLHLGR